MAPLQIKRLERGVGSVATLTAAMAALDFRLTGLAPGKDFAARLRACRLRRGLTVVDVAARAKLSRTTVASLERGGGTVASLLRLMKVIAPRARRRAQERAYWGEGDKADRDVRFTPPEFLANIHDAFGAIDLDPCGHRLSPVVAERRDGQHAWRRSRRDRTQAILARLRLDPARQLIAAQCSGTLLLAKLGLIGDLPACTDLSTKPWVVEAGVTVIDAPFAAHGNVVTAGGCLAAPYLAAWMIARGGSPDLAREALHHVAPVREKDRFVDHALSVIAGEFTEV